MGPETDPVNIGQCAWYHPRAILEGSIERWQSELHGDYVACYAGIQAAMVTLNDNMIGCPGAADGWRNRDINSGAKLLSSLCPLKRPESPQL